MATFLDKLFGTQATGFFSSLFGGGKGATPATVKPVSFPPRESRLAPVRGVLADLLRPPQTGVLPPPRVETPLRPEEIPVIVEEEDFLETPAETQVQVDALSGYDPKTQHWLRSGERLYVFSSNVSALRYHWPKQDLDVEYLNGSIYRYFGVEPHVVVDFSYTLSPGRYRWRVLGDPRWGTVQYDYERIKDATVRGRPSPRVAREVPGFGSDTIKKIPLLGNDFLRPAKPGKGKRPGPPKS